nr:UDP binding domain-containing protein [Pseudoalteromonas viridis]
MDIVKELQDFNMLVYVIDDWVNPEEVKHEYGIDLIAELEKGKYDGVVLAVGHSELNELRVQQFALFGKENHVLYDVKHVLKPSEADIRL